MIVENAIGINCTPGADSVSVAGDGSISSWDPTSCLLTQSTANVNVYHGAFRVTNSLGATVNYKYTINGGSIWENNGVGPGGAQNRQFVMPTSDLTPPVDYFNNRNQPRLGIHQQQRTGSGDAPMGHRGQPGTGGGRQQSGGIQLGNRSDQHPGNQFSHSQCRRE
jgi:hypothetical protein